MIGNRQRGFINFYVFFNVLTAFILVMIYAALLPWVPGIKLSPTVNLNPYALAIAIGVMASRRHVDLKLQNHRIVPLNQAFALALRQTMYVAVMVFALMFATKDRDISRLFLGTYLVVLTIILTISHRITPNRIARFLFPTHLHLPTLLVGHRSKAHLLENWVRERRHLGMEMIGYLGDAPDEKVEQRLPYLGTLTQLKSTIEQHKIAQVILLEWIDDAEEMTDLADVCLSEGSRLLIYNNFAKRFGHHLAAHEEAGEHFLALQSEPLEDPINRALKRALDIVISLPVVLLVLPPLTLFVWITQRVQAPGPVFFLKPRGGQRQQSFDMYKYRSMYAADHNINQQATATDSRIYPFGKFLRKSSLDEIPQFINVLMGDMSVVGPRPHLPQHDEEFRQIATSYRTRSLVKPGITGLAQVSGFRGEITDNSKLHQRVYWDLNYVANWTFRLDLHIIFLTAWQVIRPPKTAY